MRKRRCHWSERFVYLWRDFQDHQQCSYIFHQVGLGYARISAFTKAGVPHCTMRYLPEKVPS